MAGRIAQRRVVRGDSTFGACEHSCRLYKNYQSTIRRRSAKTKPPVNYGYIHVAKAVGKYYPALASSVDACLAVFGSMALGGRTKPLSLIFETPSGFGKTAILQMVSPGEHYPGAVGFEQYAYRGDKFTPKSFVTHAANVKKSELAEMDLLPKLQGKVLVTKELAPIFRGRMEELQENFSILISVLDGQGFTSDTGMQGRRGYQKQMIFNWVGATTPLPLATHQLMSQLGTRLLFYEVPASGTGEFMV